MPIYGVAFGWVPADTAQKVEVLRYSSSGLSTGAQESIAIVEPGTTSFIDFLPNDNTLRWYNVRHVQTGYVDGAYSTHVRAKPRPIPQYEDPQIYEI